MKGTYQFNETCQCTVPQAFEAFFESTSFEDAIRNAISIGGDSDTLAAITGGIAEVYWGISGDVINLAKVYLDPNLLDLVNIFDDHCDNSISAPSNNIQISFPDDPQHCFVSISDDGIVKVKSSNLLISTKCIGQYVFWHIDHFSRFLGGFYLYL